jgi:catechol 2,3-dioxygenase-like lactoylglutathione lyase family enzyme
MRSPLHAIMIYARDMTKTTAFYGRYFGLTPGEKVEGLIELTSPDGGVVILVHQAAKSIKLGQVALKLVFAVEDVEAFKAKSAELGLTFGSTHQANGYAFANAKDPDKNSVSISSRAQRQRD